MCGGEKKREKKKEKKMKRETKKESLECSRVWWNGREKKEERRIKKKRERVRVWRRKKKGKKNAVCGG